MEPTLNLNALATFRVVMKVGSFSEAGKALGYTQSAVSQQIGSLERSLGLQLFERKARTIQPTGAARYLFARSEDLGGLVARLEHDVARLSAGQAGRIRIGFFISAGPNLLPNALARFLMRRRQVQVTLHEGEPDEIIAKTLVGELDVALVFRYDGIAANWPPELRVLTLMTDPLLVIAPRAHRYASREAISLGNLVEEQWISTSERSHGHESFLRTTTRAGYQPDLVLMVDDFAVIQGLVRTSLGIAMIPKLAYAPHPDMISLPVQGLPQRHVAAVTPSVEASPLVHSFVVAVRDAAAELAAATDQKSSDL